MKRSNRITLILGVAALSAIALFFQPPISQPPEYHDFADQREFFGLPHFLDIVSNLPFLLVGAWALTGLLRFSPGHRPLFLEDREKWPWIILFLGAFLIGLGSAFYHGKPTNETLAWDRLPMTLVSMSLLAAVLCERIGIKTGLRWLAPLLIAGTLSVLYWAWGERTGTGDLRPYALVQFLPLLIIPLLILLFPPRYTETGGYIAALGWYVLAKVAEALDRPIFAAGEIVSGHTLKHMLAAAALYWLYRMISRRQPAPALRPAGDSTTNSRRKKSKRR